MKISLEPPSQPDVLQLIDDLDAFQKPLYPAESHHGIDIHALEKSNVLFAVARDHDGQAIACGAMVLNAAYGELKRFYTKPSHRAKGSCTRSAVLSGNASNRPRLPSFRAGNRQSPTRSNSALRPLRLSIVCPLR